MQSNYQVQKDPIKTALKERLIGLLRKPTAEERRPSNKSWIAYLGFNLVMATLDLISAVTVAALTNALYGILTFLAGFLALVLHETLFTNAHANQAQKNLSIGGGILAIVSTVGIGVLAGMVNVFNLAATIPIQTIELWMIIGMVLIAGLHGVLWGIYYFTDDAHRSEMRFVANQAYRELQKRNLESAKQDVMSVKAINGEIEAMGDDAPLLQEAYRESTGRDLVTRIPADPNMPFIERYNAEVPTAGKSFREDMPDLR
jgi:hypothetical protein